MTPYKSPAVTVYATEAQQDNIRQINRERQAQHERRVRIIKGIEHLLTGLVSLVVTGIAARTYIIYEQTKTVPGAWPDDPNLLPTIMLFATAVAATVMDVFALIAYLWPHTTVGSMAFRMASGSRYVITSIKSISYTYSAVVSRVTCNQGNSTGQLNDLWSWSCSSKADAMASVNQSNSICRTSAIANYLSFANVAVEVLVVIVDGFVSIDEYLWKKKHPVTDDNSDNMPLLLSSSYQGASGSNSTKHKYSKVTDDQYNKLDGYQGAADKYMGSQLSTMSKMDKMDMQQSPSLY